MTDLISRQAAIEVMLLALEDEWEQEYATDRMNELPSVQPEQRWIPCGERLPEGFQTCIVTDEWRQCSYEYDYNPKNEFVKKYGWRYNGRKIVAWMPMPEPWKGEEE